VRGLNASPPPPSPHPAPGPGSTVGPSAAASPVSSSPAAAAAGPGQGVVGPGWWQSRSGGRAGGGGGSDPRASGEHRGITQHGARRGCRWVVGAAWLLCGWVTWGVGGCHPPQHGGLLSPASPRATALVMGGSPADALVPALLSSSRVLVGGDWGALGGCMRWGGGKGGTRDGDGGTGRDGDRGIGMVGCGRRERHGGLGMAGWLWRHGDGRMGMEG